MTLTKRGQSLLYLDGSAGSYVTVQPNPDFNFQLADWTIDFYATLIDPTTAYLLSFIFGDPAVDETWLAIERVSSSGTTTRFRVRYRVAGVDIWTLDSTSGEFRSVAGPLFHVALVRFGTQVSLYIDGTLYGSVTTNQSINLGVYAMHLGRSFLSGSNVPRTMHGYIDDVRVQLGATWTSDFTPFAASWAPRFEASVRGFHSVRNPFGASVRGAHGVGVRGFEQSLRGAHQVLAANVASVRGTHAVLNSVEAGVRGMHNVAMGHYESAIRGAHRVRNSFSQSIRGVHPIVTTSFVQSIRGVSMVLQNFESSVRGEHAVRNEYQSAIRGESGVRNDALDRYEVFHAIGARPDFTAAPFATSPTLPITTPAITGAGIHHLVTRKRNAFGLTSENITSDLIELDATDTLLAVKPTAPISVNVIHSGSNKAILVADYEYGVDGDLAADEWKVYARDGALTAASDVDLVATLPIVKADGIARVSYEHQFGASQGRAGFSVSRSSDGRRSDIVEGLIDMTVLISIPADRKLDFV